MNTLNKLLLVTSYALFITAAGPATGSPTENSTDTFKLYKDNCAECHNEHRLGGMGPALLPENLKRLRKDAAVDVIKNGRFVLAGTEELNTPLEG